MTQFSAIFPMAAGPHSQGGRVFHPAYRGQGLSRAMMLKAIGFIETGLCERAIRIQAQAHLAGFYRSLGLRAVSGVYVDDSIPHVDMRYEKQDHPDCHPMRRPMILKFSMRLPAYRLVTRALRWYYFWVMFLMDSCWTAVSGGVR